jgi:hypothetical protein
MLANSEFHAEHRTISEILHAIIGDVVEHGFQNDLPKEDESFKSAIRTDNQERTRLYLAWIERAFAFDAKLGGPGDWRLSHFYDYGQLAHMLRDLFDRGVNADAVVLPTFDWFSCYRFNHYATPIIERVLQWVKFSYGRTDLPSELVDRLITLDGQHRDVGSDRSELMQAIIDEFLGDGPWRLLAPCEVWSEMALADIAKLPSQNRERWHSLLRHCQGATAPRPSAKWLKTGTKLAGEIGHRSFSTHVLMWFDEINRGRRRPIQGMSWENVDETLRMHEGNAIVLRGLLWLCPLMKSPDLTRAVGKVGTSAYRKIRGVGPRAVKVGNAAVYALSEMCTEDAIGQLAMLKARVKFGTALKEIEKAFNATAKSLNIPTAEVEEMAVPAYGLTNVGICEEPMGEFTARLKVTGTSSTELIWIKPDGKTQRSTPAAVKASHTEELKELQGAAKDIQRMLPAQRERIDSLFLQQKSWPLGVWRERYLDHPLVGVLARRLLWEFTAGTTKTTGIWFNDALVDVDLKPIAGLSDSTTVALWHPIGRDLSEIVAWRAWLDAQQIQQPFKQAHREVYLLTDAERRTRTYSNRYAAHLIKQHQFNALAALRGWKNKLRLMVDDEYPPASLLLPMWGLRAEFWIEGAGTEYGADTNDTGTFLRLTTDQVRFYAIESAQRTAHAGGGGYHAPYRTTDAEPVPLEQIPPLVFSEVMRDVDLFVGVASVGNDPTWSDGGPEGRYRDYWHEYSFGELGATAKTRKEVLERLLPRLKISGQCSFAERFLVVHGKLRTYKIHLGSGNILMEPNDQYLCIVPSQGAAAGDKDVFLPFEGDRTLSVILSKAFLLTADDKIKDSSIVSQIRRG